MKKKKNVKFTKEYPLNIEGKDGEYIGFTLRITESRAEIETLSKDWKICFKRETYEYNYIIYMINKGSLNTLHSVAVAIFLTRWIFRDAEMIKDMFELSEKVQERVRAAQQAPTQSDEMILAEEKVFTERTAESIDELEALKLSEEAKSNNNTENE